MAGQNVKSFLQTHLGDKAKKAMAATAETPVHLSGGGDLPAGIENGVARLVEIKLDTFKNGDLTGKPFVMFSGVVVSPKTFTDAETGAIIPLEGMRTSIGPEPLCDTPNRTRKTIDDHLEWMQNEIKKFGISKVDYDNLPAIIEALNKSGPLFLFRTWKGKPTEQYPDPRVNHDWRGLANLAADDGPSDEVDDTTEDGEADGSAEDSIAPDGGDLDSLAEAADSKTKARKAERDAAAKQLEDMALAAGIEQDAIDNSDSWAAVAEMIKKGSGPHEDDAEEEAEEEEAEEAEEEAEGVKVGDVVRYVFKGSKEPAECEVMEIDGDKVKVKNLETNKVFKGIELSKLLLD